MATKNIVPRADSEGQLGTSSKHWSKGYIDDVVVKDDGNIGSASDTDAIAISSTGIITTNQDREFSGKYALQLQNIPDLASKGAGYWFDGDDDVITVDHDADIDIKTNDFSILALVKNIDDYTDDIYIVCKYEDGSENWYIRFTGSGKAQIVIETDNILRGKYRIANVVYSEGVVIYLGFVSDRDGTKGQFYVNGKAVATTETIEMSAVTFTNSGDLVLANYSTVYRQIEIHRYLQFNLALTAAEVKALSSGTPVPYKYIGASQTELMPNQVDRDFSGASAWANVDLNAYDETTDLTITASAAAQYCTLAVASAPTTIGQRYRMTYDLANIVSTWTVKSFDGTQTIGTISANATQGTLEWTAETTGGYRIEAVANNSSGDFDNFTLTQIGCVLQLEQDGIGHGQWIDKSGNELHGTVSGALPVNLRPDHQEIYIDLTVTGDTSFTLPKGYQIKSIIVKETAGNALTGGLDVGTTNGGVEVVSAMAVGANSTVNCTLVAVGTIGGTHTTADDIIYLTDGDDDANWNSASLEVRIQMQRLTVN